MGDTLDAIQAGTLGRFQTVVAVEGYNRLLTDGPTAAALAAWTGTDWSSALGGLQVKWAMRQSIRPWDVRIDVGRISFGVAPTPGNDHFGEAVGKLAGGTETVLTTAIDCDDTSVVVKRADAFDASGEIHIHGECLAYSSRDTGTDTFTISTRGKYSPLSRSGGGRYARAHLLPSTDTPGVQLQPWVTSVPRDWIGRWVVVYIHRSVAGTLDLKAEAHLAFAGRIVEVRDSEDGMTWVECEDARGAIRDCVLMRDQYRARMNEGLFLQRGTRIGFQDVAVSTVLNAGDFSVVASGASGDDEINEGTYTYDEIVDALNAWLSSEKAAARLNHRWNLRLAETDDGLRTAMRVSQTLGTLASGTLFLELAASPVTEFLGFRNVDRVRFDPTVDYDHDYFSDEVPYRTLINTRQVQVDGGPSFGVTDERGTWFNNAARLPADFGVSQDTADSYGLVRFDSGALALCRKSGTTFYPWMPSAVKAYLAELGGEVAGLEALMPILSQRMDAGADEITLSQVAVLSGPMSTVVLELLSSTGTSGNNHATYDALPAQLGAAVPWELIQSLPTDLSTLMGSTADVDLVIEKPTKLSDVIKSELLLRACHLVWKSGGIRVASWATPTAATALHSLTEANKAADPGQRTSERTVGQLTDQFCANLVKVKFGRRLSGEGDYRDSRTVIDISSMDQLGSRPVAIEARNIRKAAVVENLLSHLSALLPLFSRPLLILRRSIALPLFEACAPGDQCSVTDEHVRDPADGIRGITAKPGLIIGHERDFGGREIDTGKVAGMYGTVEVVIWARDRVATYTPCADVDETAASYGYDAGTKVLTVKAHAYSESSHARDATRFAVGDKVKVIERDPTTAASPLQWSDEIASVESGGNNRLGLVTGLAGFDTAKRYFVVFEDWGTAASTQKTKVYQADDADGLIADDAAAYEYGWQAGGARTWTAEDMTAQPVELYSTEAYGDGVGLDVGYETALIRQANALVNMRTAPCVPVMGRDVMAYSTGSPVRTIVAIIPVAMGPGDLGSLGDRKLWIKPWLRSSTGGSAQVRVSLCAHAPVGTSRVLSSAGTEYRLVAPYETATWSTTSTTWAQGSSAQGLSFRNLDSNGNGYLVIEVNSVAETRGLVQCRAGLYSEEG